MSRVIGDTELAIAERFFFAIDELRKRRVIRGLKTFTDRHGINYGNMHVLMNNLERKSVRTEYLAFLAQDYGVSCTWLLLGDGEMFIDGSPALY